MDDEVVSFFFGIFLGAVATAIAFGVFLDFGNYWPEAEFHREAIAHTAGTFVNDHDGRPVFQWKGATDGKPVTD
jgi:hypothetical protein